MKKILLSALVFVASTFAAHAIEGELSGRFTINAEGDTVHFSKGNLYYQSGSLGVSLFQISSTKRRRMDRIVVPFSIARFSASAPAAGTAEPMPTSLWIPFRTLPTIW